jgi:hypothetical protein
MVIAGSEALALDHARTSIWAVLLAGMRDKAVGQGKRALIIVGSIPSCCILLPTLDLITAGRGDARSAKRAFVRFAASTIHSHGVNLRPLPEMQL